MDSKERKGLSRFRLLAQTGKMFISQTPTASITEETTENNPPEKNYAELLLRKMQRIMTRRIFPTISMNEL